MAFPPQSRLDAAQLADVSALADGSLPASRRAEVEATLDASPELSGLYEQQRRAIELLREACAQVQAPASLRAMIPAAAPRRLRRPSRLRMPRWRLVLGGGLSAATAALVAALALLLPTGAPGSPTLAQAAALAPRGPTLAAPPADPHHPGSRLAQGIDDAYFPNWSRRFGWRPTGQRIDDLSQQRAVTVYYEGRGRKIAYTILTRPALKPTIGRPFSVAGLKLRAVNIAGREVITWRRDGHTCVLSGAGVSASALGRLAAWKPAVSE